MWSGFQGFFSRHATPLAAIVGGLGGSGLLVRNERDGRKNITTGINDVGTKKLTKANHDGQRTYRHYSNQAHPRIGRNKQSMREWHKKVNLCPMLRLWQS